MFLVTALGMLSNHAHDMANFAGRLSSSAMLQRQLEPSCSSDGALLLQVTTEKMIRKQLTEQTGEDMAPRKAFIKEQVCASLGSAGSTSCEGYQVPSPPAFGCRV